MPLCTPGRGQSRRAVCSGLLCSHALPGPRARTPAALELPYNRVLPGLHARTPAALESSAATQEPQLLACLSLHLLIPCSYIAHLRTNSGMLAESTTWCVHSHSCHQSATKDTDLDAADKDSMHQAAYMMPHLEAAAAAPPGVAAAAAPSCKAMMSDRRAAMSGLRAPAPWRWAGRWRQGQQMKAWNGSLNSMH
eukprot:1160973-Pelagomonas_calceolata.AAC.10